MLSVIEYADGSSFFADCSIAIWKNVHSERGRKNGGCSHSRGTRQI